MKYGVVYYKDTDNIGDDIQNYAIMQFLPRVDYLIDREQMNSFETDETVAVILNGWFLHNKFNWPPAKNIYPLCLSMHFTKNDYLDIGYKYLDGVGGAYLKNYEPIGSRDQSTYDILEKKGIKTYLSGCATLTLPRNEKERENHICLVDVPFSVEDKISSLLENSDIDIRKTSHTVDYKTEDITWKKRMERVEEILSVYQKAKCVVTKRLHCALPCLALGTPVLLLLDKDKDDVTRYSHFTDLLHVTSTNDFINGNLSYDIMSPPPNKSLYVQDRENIIARITEFIRGVSTDAVSQKHYEWKEKSDFQIQKWRMELLEQSAKYAAKRIDNLLYEKNSLQLTAYNDLEQASTQYNQDIAELQAHIQNKAIEEERLNNVIAAKEEEENRLNDVIRAKNREEEIIKDILDKKENILGKVQEYVLEMERTSMVWLLFFSGKYRNANIKRKIVMILNACRYKRIDKRQIDEIMEDNVD